MYAKYSQVPTSDEDSAVTLNTSSPFEYQKTDFSPYYTYPGRSQNQYRSAFDYSPQRGVVESSHLLREQQGLFNRVCSALTTGLCAILIILTFPVSIWFCVKVAKQYERIVIFRLGKKRPDKGPGITFLLPCIDRPVIVDMRTKAFNVPPQTIFTSDNAVIEIGADIYFGVQNAVQSVMNVQDINHALRLLSQTTVQKIVARYTLRDIERNKNLLAAEIMASVNQTAAGWGVELSKVELSQVNLLQDAPAPDVMRSLSNVFPGLIPPSIGSAGVEPPPVYERVGDTLQGNASLFVQQQTKTTTTSPKNLLDKVKPLLNESLVRQYSAVYQFDVLGEQGGVYYMDLKTGHGSAGEGPPPFSQPDVTLTMSEQDLAAMLSGDLKALQAYMSGRLRVSGDLNAAMRLEDLFDRLAIK